MSELRRSMFLPFVIFAFVSFWATGAFAQQNPYFAPGNLVVAVEGCGVRGGTCTSVANGAGNGAGNSSNNGYGDNQAAPLTLFQFQPNGTSSVTYVNSLVLPQSPSNANFQVSGEYGSSSEATLQLSGSGQYLTIMGYGIDALSFNANPENYGTLLNPKGAPNYGALGQTGSLTLNNQTANSSYPTGYTPVPRVLALIDAYGNVNTASAFYNIFDFNNPRSAFTADGSSVYLSGQGSGTDTTGGVFYSAVGGVNNTPTAITGVDSCAVSDCTTPTIAQDTRTVQIYNGTLYVSVDSTEGHSNNRSYIGTLGTPAATSMYLSTSVPTGDLNGPTDLKGFGNTGGTGKVTIATSGGSNGNPLNNSTSASNGVALDLINLSPSNYFFASPSVLYVADTGDPKNDSEGDNNCNGTANIGDGGLQKWVNSKSNGSGTWSLQYTLYQGLNLVNNCNVTGTTGLYGLTGVVSGNSVYLYATNFTLSDLDDTYLYGITDTLSNTTPPGTSQAFTLLATAPSDSNFKGVSFAPSLPAHSATITSSPSGLAVSVAGTDCDPNPYTTPVTLTWTPGSSCQLSVASPQGSSGTQYTFSHWQDGSTSTTDNVMAPSTSAVYTATFSTAYELTTSAGAGGTVSTGGYIPAGENAAVTATPNAGYYFVNFTGTTTSTSNPLTLTVNAPQTITANFAPKVTPMVALSASPTSANYGSSVALTADVTYGGNPVTSGTVTFYHGTTPLGTEPVNSTGMATLSTSALPVGADSLTASYAAPAQGMYTTATSAAIMESVLEPPTITLTTTATLAKVAGSYQATVTIANSGSATAANVQITAATLGSATGSVPVSFGSIAAAGSVTKTITFPLSAGSDGTSVAEKFSGTYTGGTFSASVRAAMLP